MTDTQQKLVSAIMRQSRSRQGLTTAFEKQSNHYIPMVNTERRLAAGSYKTAVKVVPSTRAVFIAEHTADPEVLADVAKRETRISVLTAAAKNPEFPADAADVFLRRTARMDNGCFALLFQHPNPDVCAAAVRYAVLSDNADVRKFTAETVEFFGEVKVVDDELFSTLMSFEDHFATRGAASLLIALAEQRVTGVTVDQVMAAISAVPDDRKLDFAYRVFTHYRWSTEVGDDIAEKLVELITSIPGWRGPTIGYNNGLTSWNGQPMTEGIYDILHRLYLDGDTGVSRVLVDGVIPESRFDVALDVVDNEQNGSLGEVLLSRNYHRFSLEQWERIARMPATQNYKARASLITDVLSNPDAESASTELVAWLSNTGDHFGLDNFLSGRFTRKPHRGEVFELVGMLTPAWRSNNPLAESALSALGNHRTVDVWGCDWVEDLVDVAGTDIVHVFNGSYWADDDEETGPRSFDQWLVRRLDEAFGEKQEMWEAFIALSDDLGAEPIRDLIATVVALFSDDVDSSDSNAGEPAAANPLEGSLSSQLELF